jgi:hypothetical protein
MNSRIGAGLVCALALATQPALAQSTFQAVRGDRASGWLPQTRSEVLARNGPGGAADPGKGWQCL